MSQDRYRAARVNWRLGQALLPAHFYAQEDSLRLETAARFEVGPAPQRGLAHLHWDGFQLLQGRLVVDELLLVLPGGLVVDVPGNTEPPEALQLAASGSVTPTVYLHILSEGRVIGGEEDDELETVERSLFRLELGAQQVHPRATRTFKLGRFKVDPQGRWGVSPEVIPELLALGSVPSFDPLLQRLSGTATALSHSLADQASARHMTAEMQLAALHALQGMYELRAYLEQLRAELRPHPWELFWQTYRAYLHVATLYAETPDVVVYRHADLAGCFGELLGRMEQYLGYTSEGDAPRTAPFEPGPDGGSLRCALPDTAARARALYVLVHKPEADMVLELAEHKLAAPSRLALLHQRALKGIQLQRVEQIPFRHRFSTQVEFWQLTPGVEWDHAVAEGALAVFADEELARVRLYLLH